MKLFIVVHCPESLATNAFHFLAACRRFVDPSRVFFVFRNVNPIIPVYKKVSVLAMAEAIFYRGTSLSPDVEAIFDELMTSVNRTSRGSGISASANRRTKRKSNGEFNDEEEE